MDALPEAGDRHKWIVGLTCLLGIFMEILDTSVANVALSTIQGSFAAGTDEVTWVITTYLVANAGRVISRDEILGAVWGTQHTTDSNVIEVFVCHIRNKIGDRENRVIQTIRGVGYFFARG